MTCDLSAIRSIYLLKATQWYISGKILCAGRGGGGGWLDPFNFFAFHGKTDPDPT